MSLSGSVLDVNDGLVQKVELYRSYYWLFRWDVFPFAFAYGALFSLAISDVYETKLAGLIGVPCVLFTQLLLFLLAQWSTTLKCRLGNKRVSDVNAAELVHVFAAKNAGSDKITPLYRRRFPEQNVEIAGESFHMHTGFFEFQQVLYEYDSASKCFARTSFPTTGSTDKYLQYIGHKTELHVRTSLVKWGFNLFDIPIPLFLDLYVEHLTAPFFVFQVLCLLLWSLDDYWYYSVFTLLMLMFFEGMLCRQRQSSLLMLRNMRRPPTPICVLRCGQWMQASSEELCPGDVISLTAATPSVGQGTPDFQSKASSEDMVVPCDALIIRGSCLVNEAMLTGESVPQIKESISCADDKGGMVSLGRDNTIDPQWKRHLVLGGTVMLQHSPLAGGEKAAAGGKDLHSAPDKGCVAVVVRTGYGTIQGGLMRKILFATERVNANSSETFAFIGVLVVFAVLASVVVLHGGLQDENRNRFKLALHCIMIITSVVPPELPMELSLAVTNSLGALSRHLVFCTEPFRIPFAGKLDILCFDKTGTLTKDKMILKGVVSARHVDLFSTAATKGNDEQDEVTFETVADPSAEDSPAVVSAIMASCHSLVLQQPGQEVLGRPNYLGDPLEVATMMSSGFIFERGSSQGDGSMAPSATSSVRGLRVSIKHRFPFNSTLKRMSVLTEVQDVSSASVAAGSSSTSSSGPKSKSALYIFTKGAPEVIQDRLASVPASYTKAYVYHMCRGKRVLALACRKISTGVSDVLKESRENIERDLIFVGFLVYDCDLKIDSKSVIKELKGANHKLAMITGDSVYTAIDVSRRLGMLRADAPILVLHSIGKRGLVWRKLAESGNSKEPATGTLDAERVASDVDFSDDRSTIASIAQSSNVTISGAGLGALIDSCGSSVLSSICPHVVVFARVSPAQKEIVLRALNDSGLYTLMCGDGTNDVGALKAAHVGVSIVNDADFESRIEGVTDSESTTKKGKKAKGSNSKDRLARAMAELQEQEVDPTVVKLGDASIASPFTSRRTSIDSVLTVIRQGRATQVTTVQVFKILALNCLVSAYMMSALYLRGLKQGDMQMTATGLITAALFFFLSQAKPLIILAPHKPPGSAFAPSVMVSVVGQFVVHLGCLVATLSLCEQYSRSDDLPTLADGKFQPNVVNSATFLLSAVMQVNNFVVNYRGHPFTQSIQENVMLWRSVQGIYAALLVVMGGQLEPLNDFLQLAPFPSSEFQASLLAILLVNFGLTFGLEKAAQRLE